MRVSLHLLATQASFVQEQFDLVAVAVQDRDVPGAEAVAVVPPARRPSGGAEIGEVGSRPGAVVLVVADRGPRARPVAAPAPRVAAFELGRRAAVVGEIADREDDPLTTVGKERVEQLRGPLVRVGSAVGDVSGADEDRKLGRGGALG